MTSNEYFKALCNAETRATLFLRTVEDVSGLLEMRPREQVTDYLLSIFMRWKTRSDSHTSVMGTSPEDYLVQPLTGKYAFLETVKPRSERGSYIRFLKILRQARNHISCNK